MYTKTHGLILAAGLSNRMGDFKPLMHIEGRTLIENSIESMLLSGISCVTVVLGYRADEVKLVLRQRYTCDQVCLAYNDNYADSDMLYSIKIGVNALQPCEDFFLLPGDMPAVSQSTFHMIQAAKQQTDAKIAFPTLGGRYKHPPLISSNCIDDIMAFNDAGGLRELWKQYGDSITTVAVDDIGCCIDNDTQQDFARCAAYMKQTRLTRQPIII